MGRRLQDLAFNPCFGPYGVRLRALSPSRWDVPNKGVESWESQVTAGFWV